MAAIPESNENNPENNGVMAKAVKGGVAAAKWLSGAASAL
jgi:hypothetical protein